MSLDLPFLAEIANVVTALGETNASTLGEVRQTEASTLLWETKASTIGRHWEIEASTKRVDGSGEIKTLTHVFFEACGNQQGFPQL